MANIPLQKRPTLVICATGSVRHIQLLWELEKLTLSFSKSLSWEIQVVTFFKDGVEGMLPPILLLQEAWWGRTERQIISPATVVTPLLVLKPTRTEVPGATAEK